MRTVDSGIYFAASLLLGAAMATSAFAQDEERHSCLQYDHVEAIHQIDRSHIVLEVEGGTTLYLVTVEDRCFTADLQRNISIEGNGKDSCIRTTDHVNYGRRQCGIEDFEIIESQDQLDQVMAGELN